MINTTALKTVSTIFGFISFGLTVLIWLNSFWGSIIAILHAPVQIRDQLSTLRQGLLEERSYLQRKRLHGRHLASLGPRIPYQRYARPDHPGPFSNNNYNNDNVLDTEIESDPTRIISDAVDDLIASFKALEAPFLVEAKKDRNGNGVDDDLEWSYQAAKQHYRCGLLRRVIWLRNRGGVNAIAVRLQRVQTRRNAQEVLECRFMLADVKDRLGDQEC